MSCLNESPWWRFKSWVNDTIDELLLLVWFMVSTLIPAFIIAVSIIIGLLLITGLLSWSDIKL